MHENQGYIKARIKTQEQIVEVYPEAECWGQPLSRNKFCHGADEVLLPYLGKTIWVRKKRLRQCEFVFEMKDNGLIVLPDWIQYFDTADLVPPAKWDDGYDELVDDIWVEPLKERWTVIEDLLIVTG